MSSRVLGVGRRKQVTTTESKIETEPGVRNELLNRMYNIPEVQILAKIPGIENYFHQDLVTDLISWVPRFSPEEWASLIAISDPKNPRSIIFKCKFQDEHRETLKMEESTITFSEQAIDDIEHPCGKCGSIKLYVEVKQLRGGDEGATSVVKCAKCGFTFKIQ